MAAFRVLLQNLCKQYSNLLLIEATHGSAQKICSGSTASVQLTSSSVPILNCWRFSHSFVSRLTAQQLWKGVTSVSPAGRRKGRGKGSARRMAKDLNRGQVIGFGKKNMLWPGLNAPVIQGRELIRQQELPPDESREKRIFELRDKMSRRRSFKIHPLERGWSGSKLPGRSLGPPDPVGEETFEGFDSRVLQFHPLFKMTAQRGRVRRLTAFVVVGNKNGLAGYAKAISMNGNTAAISARNKAAKNLRYIERDNTTVLHDFYTEFGAVKIFVKKKPEGYGLRCHRVIKAICEMLGIKDMHAKVEGPTHNYKCVTKAFFVGLMRQKSPQQIASEKGLHIIERRNDRDNFPVVVASPEKCRTEEEISPTELLDYDLHLHNYKVEGERKPFQPFYINFPSYIEGKRRKAHQRNMRSVRINLLAKYGAITSFLKIREEEKSKKELKDTVES